MRRSKESPGDKTWGELEPSAKSSAVDPPQATRSVACSKLAEVVDMATAPTDDSEVVNRASA